MVFMRKLAPAGDGVYAFKTRKNHRILWKSPNEALERPQEPRTPGYVWNGEYHARVRGSWDILEPG